MDFCECLYFCAVLGGDWWWIDNRDVLYNQNFSNLFESITDRLQDHVILSRYSSQSWARRDSDDRPFTKSQSGGRASTGNLRWHGRTRFGRRFEYSTLFSTTPSLSNVTLNLHDYNWMIHVRQTLSSMTYLSRIFYYLTRIMIRVMYQLMYCTHQKDISQQSLAIKFNPSYMAKSSEELRSVRKKTGN